MRIALLLILLLLSVPAHAAFQGPGAGGFKGPTVGVEITSVKQALEGNDDAPVLLTGTIVGRKAGSDDKYIFRDATGELTVDIDKEVFAGRTVTPENTVKLSGKVDKDMLEPTKVDVKVLEILN